MGGPLFSSAEITARRSQTGVHERQNILEGGGRIAGTMKERLWPELCRGRPIIERWVARQLHSLKSFRAIFALALNIKLDLLWLENCLSQNVRSKIQVTTGKHGFYSILAVVSLLGLGI